MDSDIYIHTYLLSNRHIYTYTSHMFQSILSSEYCTVYRVFCTMYSEYCTVYSEFIVQCTFGNLSIRVCKIEDCINLDVFKDILQILFQ